MKKVAKWVLIIWSLLCLIGVLAGMANIGGHIESGASDATRTGQALGIGCGMGIWVAVWAGIALPALIIYLVAGKREAMPVSIEVDKSKSSKLCTECGKYYEGQSRFCPNCGKPVS